MKRLYPAAFWILAAISLLGGFIAPHDPAHDMWWNRLPAFFALFGFIGCLLLIFLAKFPGKYLLRKREDYYDAD